MPKLGDLLPTRERIMEGRDETGSLLVLAERAEAPGFDPVRVGDFGAGAATPRSADPVGRSGGAGAQGRARYDGSVAAARERTGRLFDAPAAWLESYADTGVTHMCLCLAGDPEPQREAAARIRPELGW